VKRGCFIEELAERGVARLEELAAACGVSRSHAYRLAAQLEALGLAAREGGVVRVADPELLQLLKRVKSKFSLAELLAPKALELLECAADRLTLEAAAARTGLSRSGLSSRLARLRGLGAVRVEGGRLAIADPDVAVLVERLRARRAALIVEPYAEILYAGRYIVKRVPAGAPARGAPTGFTALRRFSIDIASGYDYYVQPGGEVGPEEAIVHALLAARSRYERTLAAVAYAKLSKTLNSAKLVAAARGTPALPLVLELGDYASGLPTEHSDLFLPWDEFRQLARLYGVEAKPAPPLAKVTEALAEAGRLLTEHVECYALGGLALVLESVKEATGDVDLAVLDKRSFKLLLSALRSASFEPPAEAEPKGAAVLERGDVRVDLFLAEVAGARITEAMAKRAARSIAYGRLVVKVLSLGDVAFLKAVSGRERDLEDLARIARRGLDWRVLLEDALSQEEPERFALAVLQALEALEEAHGIAPPRRLKSRLRREAAAHLVKKAVEEGCRCPEEVSALTGLPLGEVRKLMREMGLA
jgi:predicted nucleotidyltransferase